MNKLKLALALLVAITSLTSFGQQVATKEKHGFTFDANTNNTDGYKVYITAPGVTSNQVLTSSLATTNLVGINNTNILNRNWAIVNLDNGSYIFWLSATFTTNVSSFTNLSFILTNFVVPVPTNLRIINQ